jgi:hypothetical protein
VNKRLALAAVVVITAPAMPAQPTVGVPPCSRAEPVRSIVDGFEHLQSATGALRYVKLFPKDWNIVIHDLRDNRTVKSKQGNFAAPSFSLGELSALSTQPAMYVATGRSATPTAPIPSGLLRVKGQDRNPLYAQSETRNAILCVQPDRRVQLLTTFVDGRHRIAPTMAAFASCQHAVQVGPMIVDGGKPVRGPSSA